MKVKCPWRQVEDVYPTCAHFFTEVDCCHIVSNTFSYCRWSLGQGFFPWAVILLPSPTNWLPFASLCFSSLALHRCIYIYDVIRIYIYIYVAGTFRYNMNISLPLWVGSLNVSPYCIAVLSLAALSLFLFLFLFFFLSLSLSLALFLLLFFSLRAFLGIRFSSSPICVPTCLPCSLQFVSLIPSPLLFFSFLLLGCFLYLSLNCCARPLCALGRNLSSVSASSCLSSSLSFLTCSSILSQCFLHPHYSCYLWVLLGPKILLASHVFQFVSLFSQFFSLFLLHFTFLLILLSPLLFLSRL